MTGSSGEVQVKNTKQTSLSQQFWLAEVRCRKSRRVVWHLSIAASLYSGVYAQGCANVHISANLPFFFWHGWVFCAWGGPCLGVCTCGSKTLRVLVSVNDKESTLIKALLNIWEHIFLDILNCGQTSSTCFAMASLLRRQKWWKFWARARVCQAFGSGCVNKGTTDFVSINCRPIRLNSCDIFMFPHTQITLTLTLPYHAESPDFKRNGGGSWIH